MKRFFSLILVLVLACGFCAAFAEDEYADVTPEFKEMMDSYELFFNDYCDLLESVNDDPTDFTALLELSEMLEDEAEMLEAMDELGEDEDMSAADMAYYLEVHARILKRISETAYTF